MIDKDNLDELLQRFFDGDTTNAEDKALEEYFRTGDVPARYECYRDMFGWYADGMDENKLPSAKQEGRRKHGFPAVKGLRWGSIAAAIALAAGIGWVSGTGRTETDNLYAENYIVRDGRLITGMDEIKADIDASVLEGDFLEQEIEMNIRMLNTEQIAE